MRLKSRFVLLVCDRRARAFRCWWYWSRSATRLISVSADWRSSHQLWTMASTAACTWHTVTSGFFFLQPLAAFCEEQVADRREDEVPLQADPPAAFPMIQPHFAFVVLEASLDAPPREGHTQQGPNRRLRRRIADEVFDHVRLGISADQQMKWPARQSVLILEEHERVFHFPDHRSFLAILNTPGLPALVFQARMPVGQGFDRLRRRTAGAQTRLFAKGATSSPAIGALCCPGRVNPGDETLGDFPDEFLLPLLQCPQKRRFAPIPLIEDQPFEVHAAGAGSLVQFQGNVAFWTINHIVGDAGGTTTRAILTPALRKVQVAVQQAMKIACRVAQMDGDDAVLLFSHRTAILMLHAGCLVALFHPPGFIDQADRFPMSVL